MKPLLVIGSSGHASAVLEVIELQGKYEVAGLLDSFEPAGITKHGYKVLGTLEEAAAHAASLACESIFVAIGDNWSRWEISLRIKTKLPFAEFPAVIHPSVLVSRSARIGAGSVIMAGGIVATNAVIGEGCIVYTASTVNHDCRMDDYSSLSAGIHLGGAAVIGFRSSIGIGSTLRERVTIGRDTVIGAGTVVLNDIPSDVVAYGVPAKVARKRTQDERYMR